ncbi:MAG: DUF2848 domain-containing protein [Pseudomonadota bacterium]
MPTALPLTLVSESGEERISFEPRRLIIAGWTGRDKAAMEHHIAELEALGIPRPPTTPVFYRVSAARLTLADTIQVTGEASSGEAEYLLAWIKGRIWVGAGSDHTDREAERQGIALSKQLCDKPMAATLWPLDEVEAEWDALQLRSVIPENGQEQVYQEGTLAAMLPPYDLLARLDVLKDSVLGGESLGEGDVLFGGTLPAIGGVRPAESFAWSLVDPQTTRAIRGCYRVLPLPVAG